MWGREHELRANLYFDEGYKPKDWSRSFHHVCGVAPRRRGGCVDTRSELEEIPARNSVLLQISSPKVHSVFQLHSEWQRFVRLPVINWKQLLPVFEFLVFLLRLKHHILLFLVFLQYMHQGLLQWLPLRTSHAHPQEQSVAFFSVLIKQVPSPFAATSFQTN